MLLGWACIAVAACLGFVWLAVRANDDNAQGTQTGNDIAAQDANHNATQGTAELAMLWSATRDELEAEEDSDDFWNLPVEEPAIAALPPADGSDDELTTPEWMLAGIKTLEDAESSMPDDMDLDEGEES